MSGRDELGLDSPVWRWCTMFAQACSEKRGIKIYKKKKTLTHTQLNDKTRKRIRFLLLLLSPTGNAVLNFT
jgi:hypothetical protein